MPKGHPLPFRLLSACFGKPGASATVARSLSPRSAKGGTAASPLYGIFSAFLGLGSDTRGLNHKCKTTVDEPYGFNILMPLSNRPIQKDGGQARDTRIDWIANP